MSQFPIHLDEAQERQLLEDLKLIPHKIPVAIRTAVNRTGAKVKTIGIKAVQETLPMTRADLDENRTRHRHGGILLTKATPAARYGEVSAKVSITGRRISLSRFSPRPSSQQSTAGAKYRLVQRAPMGAKGWGVLGRGSTRQRIRGPRSQSWKVDKTRGKQKSTDTFIVRFKSGHLAIVARSEQFGKTKRGRVERPLFELFGPSIPYVAERNPDLARKLNIDVPDILARELLGQVDRFLKRPRSAPDTEDGDA